MSSSDFESSLLCAIKPNISKMRMVLKEPIPAKERLLITLRFLVFGDSYVSLQYLFKISK